MIPSTRLDLIQKVVEWLKYRNTKTLDYTISINSIVISWDEKKQEEETE